MACFLSVASDSSSKPLTEVRQVMSAVELRLLVLAEWPQAQSLVRWGHLCRSWRTASHTGAEGTRARAEAHHQPGPTSHCFPDTPLQPRPCGCRLACAHMSSVSFMISDSSAAVSPTPLPAAPQGGWAPTFPATSCLSSQATPSPPRQPPMANCSDCGSLNEWHLGVLFFRGAQPCL